MNCPICNHSINDHQKRGCYHAVPDTMSGLCLCTSTPEMIELAVVKAENVRLREALADFADPKSWLNEPEALNAGIYYRDDTLKGYEVAAAALKEMEPK